MRQLGFLLFLLVLFSGCRNSGVIIKKSIDTNNPYYYFTVAESFYIRGAYKSALKYYNKTLSLDKNNNYVLARKGISLVNLGKKEEGKHLLEKAILSGLSDKDILLAFISVSSRHYDADILERVYDKLLEQTPNNKFVIYRKADLLIYQKHYRDAVSLLKNYVKNVPNDYAMSFLLVSIYKKLGMHRSAKRLLQKLSKDPQATLDGVIELLTMYRESSTDKDYLDHLMFLYKFNPNDFILYEMLSSAVKILHSKKLKNKEHYVGILSKYLPALEDNLPLEKSLYIRIIQVLFDIHEYDVALDSLRRANATISDDTIRYATGIAYVNIGDNDDAINIFLKIGPASKHFETVTKNLINIYINESQYNLAQKLLKTRKDALKPNTYHLLQARLYEAEGLYKEAIEELKSVIQKNSKLSPDFIFYYATLLSNNGKKLESIDVVKKYVLTTEPNNLDALNYISYTYAELGIRLDEAEQMIKKVLQKKPNDPYMRDTKAWIYYKQKKYKKALDEIQYALSFLKRKTSMDDVFYKHAVEIALKLGKVDLARQYYEYLKKISNNKSLLNKIGKSIEKFSSN